MPVYEYRCSGCGAASELLLPMGDARARTCLDCGAPLRRRPSRVAVRYSGWGFTATDRLVRRPGGDFRALRERADQIADGD